MLYGISFLYGTTGTLYFGDMAARIDGSPLLVMALVFFLWGSASRFRSCPSTSGRRTPTRARRRT